MQTVSGWFDAYDRVDQFAPASWRLAVAPSSWWLVLSCHLLAVRPGGQLPSGPRGYLGRGI